MIPTLSPVYSLLSSFTLSVLVLLLYAYVLPYHSPKDTRCPKTMHGHLEVLSKFRVLYVKTSSSASQNSRLRRNGTTVVEWRDPKPATKEGWGCLCVPVWPLVGSYALLSLGWVLFPSPPEIFFKDSRRRTFVSCLCSTSWRKNEDKRP